MATLSELLAAKAALEKEIIDARREEKASAIAQIKTLMAQYGLTAADLGAKTSSPASLRGRGSKVAPKYRDPATGNTWSGRGLRPKWLVAALATGRPLSDFAV